MVGLKKGLVLGISGLALLSNISLYSQNQKFSEENLENINYSTNDSIRVYENQEILSKRKEFVEKAKKISKEFYGYGSSIFPDESVPSKINWRKIEEGLYLGELNSSIKSEYGDSKITILKMDSKNYDFNLVSSKETGGSNKTAKEWADSKGLIAVINAGMFQSENSQTNTGFMKNYDFVNNGKLTEHYNAVAVFNRKDKSVPEFQIIDLKCQDWNYLKEKYNSFSQGIRMIDCDQKNKWAKQNKRWSVSTIGEDKEGNSLFIFSRSPYTMNEFTQIILDSPLNIKKMMYLEGGPEASFYLNHNNVKVERFGSYETGFFESDLNGVYWDLPNVIGITKKKDFKK